MEITYYKLVKTKARWLGLDFFDAVLIVIVFALINLFTSAIFIGLITSCLLYLAFRVLKATKPQGWFFNILKYYLRSPYYLAIIRKREDD